jgi:peptidoglycan/xylan/chitin deacetylase (PgdA/CDA1 family)
MRFVVEAPETHPAERRYVLDVVLGEWLGLEYRLVTNGSPLVTIRAVDDDRGGRLTLPDVLLATPPDEWLTAASLPVLPCRVVEIDNVGPPIGARRTPGSSSLPVLYGDGTRSPSAWTTTDMGTRISVDIFGSIFFLVSRYEEVVNRDRDRHGRFPASASVAAQAGFLDRPLADEYVDLLWHAMATMWPSLVRPETTFRLRLTHDVDQPWSAFGQGGRAVARASAADVMRRRDARLAARRIRALYDARSARLDRDPFNAFAFLMDTSERHGLTSTFYFLAGNAPADFDFRYRLDDPPMLDLLRSVHERGHEIGLHASYVSHLSALRTEHELDALRAACRAVGFEQAEYGVRQHYLRFATPETWRIHDAAGFSHDSSVGFAEQIGFRAGTCREFPVFDLIDRRRLELRERPLVAMDATLFDYLGLSLADASERTLAIIEACRREGGDAVILYHNSSLGGTGHREQYRDLVDAVMA